MLLTLRVARIEPHRTHRIDCIEKRSPMKPARSLAAALVFAFASAACSQEIDPRVVVDPEPLATPAEYTVETPVVRVLGIEKGDRPSRSYAVIADTATWNTQNLKVGDPFGRGLRVSALGPDRVELSGPDENVVLKPGEDARVKRIVHAFDHAATYAGRHRWSVDAALVRGVRARRGVGAVLERVKFGNAMAGAPEGAPATVVKIVHVERGALVDRLGFREGDIVFAVDDRTWLDENPDSFGDAIAGAANKAVHVRIFRDGSSAVMDLEPASREPS
jgi:hypothetical protein